MSVPREISDWDFFRTKKAEHDKTLIFTHKIFKHISKTFISLISILQAVKSVIKNTGKKPGLIMRLIFNLTTYNF